MNSTHPSIQIGPKTAGADSPLYLIAEAGVNHENDMATARRMVKEAAAAGADAIKFQSYKAGSLASRYSPAYWDRAKEPADSQYALFQRFDHLDVADYRELARCCQDHGIQFLTTCFDERFVDALGDLLPVFKVASADITHFPLLKKVASTGKPVILSVGAATLEEIRAAVDWLRRCGCQQLAVLHCVLNYPCAPEASNLRAIASLAKAFPDVVVGYSDHVPPAFGLLQLNAAWMLGARILEKHYTLDKSLIGNDHYHAMDPDDIRAFRRQQAFLEALMGDGQLGAISTQEAARKFARRSLVAACDIAAGTPITAEMLAVKRPGTGIPPQDFERVLGKAPAKPIAEDTVLQWDMFGLPS